MKTKAILAATCLACVSARAYVADVTKYGAKGDGVTDDTAAVQRAIDAVAAVGGGKVYLPFTTNGYLIASPGRETDAAGRPVRAQLVIPAGRATIAFEGEMPCKFLYEYQVRPKGCEKGGFTPTRFGAMGVPNTMLHSTWDAPEVHDPSERPWSVIAAPEGKSCSGRFSVSLVAMKNLEIRVHLNKDKMYPTTSAANLHHVGRVVIEDCQFCLDDNVGDTELGKHLVENPCHTVGLHASGDQNDQQILRDVAVQGFKYGFVFGEHIVADHLYAHNCEQAVVFHDATHLSKIGMLVAQHNRTILATSQGNLFGNRPSVVNVQIDLLNFEGGQTTGVPPWISHLKCGVYDPGNRLRGSVTWHEPWGAGVFPVEGAKNFEVRRFGGAADASPKDKPASRHVADWMPGKVGVLAHYLLDGKTFADVGGFDVPGLVAQLKAMRADYFVLALGQNSGYYCSPNDTLERLAKYAPNARCSKRDIPAEVIAALRGTGIRFGFYLPSQPACRDDQMETNLGFPPQINAGGGAPDRIITEKGCENWARVIETWARRYGRDVSLWWFDGAYEWVGFNGEIAARYRAACRAGNPDVALAFNAGVRYRGAERWSDVWAGEESSRALAAMPKRGRWEAPGLQWHVLTHLGPTWNVPGCRFSDAVLLDWVRAATEKGGCVTLDLRIDMRNGRLDAVQADQFRRVRTALPSTGQ